MPSLTFVTGAPQVREAGTKLQVLLNEKSRNYLTINTHLGLFRYRRLAFGVASAPAIFQGIMDKILQGLSVGCYLDDLIITGRNDDEHYANLDAVLKRLDQHGIKLRRPKCFFLQSSVQYLGFTIDADGLHPTSDKVRAILEAARPGNVNELQSFLCLVNYYRRFLSNLSTILNPLNHLLKKSVIWKWTVSCEKSFKLLKKALVSSDVLVHYDPDKPITLAVDASPYGLGAVISHICDKGIDRPIADASRTLSSAEKNYSQIEKEALAIVFGLQKFHQYLYARKFTLITDHKPLTLILGPKKGIPVLAVSRIQRWALQLASYQYEIQYRPSGCNSNADGLSRLPLSTDIIANDTAKNVFNFLTEEATLLNTNQVQSLPVTVSSISKITACDKILSRVMHFTLHGWPSDEKMDPELKKFCDRKDEITTEEGCLLWGTRVIIPHRFQSQILMELHNNHPGIVRMKALARMHVWWPNIESDIEMCIRNCFRCQQNQTSPPCAPVNPWCWPSRPWQRVHIDFAGPFMNENFLIVVDAHSKWPEVVRMPSITSLNTIKALRHIFAAYGLPEELISDNGPQFVSHDFKEFTKMNGIRHVLSSPYHPSSNGEAERFVRTFKNGIKKSQTPDLNKKMASFLLSYRTTPHSASKCTPSELFMGRRLRTRLDILRPNLKNTMQKKFSPKPCDKYRSFNVGDPVLVKDYRNRKETWVRGVVICKLSPVTYRVQVEELIWKRHINQIIDLSGSSIADEPQNPQDCPLQLDPILPPSENSGVESTVSQRTDLPIDNQDMLVETSSRKSANVPNESDNMTSNPETEMVIERRYPLRERRQTQFYSA